MIRNILLFFYLLISTTVIAQKMPDFGMNRVRIVEPDRVIQLEVKPVTSEPGIKSDRLYYWYSSNKVHYSQGGFSGKLLNGQYTEYYPNLNLKEQGIFKKGLKDGVWKSWNEDGTLHSEMKWHNGKPGKTVSFWSKLNILKGKSKHATADTTNKNAK
jgi:antitoxin component YwqK of YwqJK toxin-antitoxin module